MKYSLILLSLILVAGCKPCERLQRKCPRTDSIVYVETIRLDTITFYTKPDTMFLMVPVPGDCPDYVITEENDRSSAHIERVDNVVSAEIICKDDSLQAIIAQKDTELKEQKWDIIEVDKPVKYVPGWHWWIFIILIVENLIIAFIIYLKVKGAPLKIFK